MGRSERSPRVSVIWPVAWLFDRTTFLCSKDRDIQHFLDILEDYIDIYKNCNLPCSSSQKAHKHTGAWLCVHFLISIYQTDGLTLVVSSLGRPGHRISHRVIFAYEDTWKTVYRTPVTDINDFKVIIAASVATVDFDMLQRTRMELAYRMYDKLCPCWVRVMFW